MIDYSYTRRLKMSPRPTVSHTISLFLRVRLWPNWQETREQKDSS